MTEYSVTVAKIHYGNQNPWVPGLEKMLQQLPGFHPEVELFELLGFKPQMWATHSVQFDWGYLPIMTLTYINPDNGRVQVFSIFLFQNEEHIVPKSTLDQISESFEILTCEEIDETLKEILRIDDGIILNRPFTSTFLTLELIKTTLHNHL